MKVKKIVAGLAAMSMLVAFSAQTVMAADAVGITAGKVTVAPGEEFAVNVRLNDLPATGISVCEFAIKYDTSVVTVTGVTAGEITKNGVEDVEQFDNVTAFYAETSVPGMVTMSYSTGQADSAYCITESGGIFATITGTVAVDAAEGTYPLEVVAIDRTVTEDSSEVNKEIKLGYIDADGNATKYEAAVTNGAINVKGEVGPTDPTDPTDPIDAKYGDVDCDGDVDIMDVILLNRNLMIGAEVKAQGLINADVDQNEKVDAVDSLNILKAVVQLITLPVA